MIFIMTAITVSIALGRLILNVMTMQFVFYSTYATIPLQLLAELETFFAAIVACLPGLRVLIRQRRAAEHMVPPFVENTVVVPDHEMAALGGGGECVGGYIRAEPRVDSAFSAGDRYSDVTGKYDPLKQQRASSEDPFGAPRPECSYRRCV